jgi:hypothetical protein
MPGFTKEVVFDFMVSRFTQMEQTRNIEGVASDAIEMRDKRVELVTEMFSYINVHFVQLVNMVGADSKLFVVIRRKVKEFIDDDRLDEYVTFKQLCTKVLAKIDDLYE